MYFRGERRSFPWKSRVWGDVLRQKSSFLFELPRSTLLSARWTLPLKVNEKKTKPPVVLLDLSIQSNLIYRSLSFFLFVLFCFFFSFSLFFLLSPADSQVIEYRRYAFCAFFFSRFLLVRRSSGLFCIFPLFFLFC